MPKTKRPSWPLLLLIGAVGAAALLELGVRALVPMDVLVYRDSADPLLRFELLPGAYGMKDDALVAVNSRGMRGPEFAEKAPGSTRVAVVGGHESFGLGVTQEETFVHRLAASAAADLKRPVETLNLSMHSYTLKQKTRLACARLSGLQADVAVLQLDDEDTRRLPEASVQAPALKNFLRETSAFLRMVAERRFWRRAAVQAAAQRAAEQAPVPAGAPAPAGAKTESPEEALAREQLALYKRCLDEAGVAGAVVFVPNLSMPADSAAPRAEAFRAALKKHARKLGLEFQDAGPALRRLPPAKALKRPHDPVLSPEAHRVLAEEVRALLRRVKPKPGRPSA